MANPTAPNELKQLPEFKTNLQDLFCRRNLSFQDNRKKFFRLSQPLYAAHIYSGFVQSRSEKGYRINRKFKGET